MEEMYECGMEVAVRMGTVMALEDDMLGKFVIPIAAMRREGNKRFLCGGGLSGGGGY